ncbi:MAG: M56 family metallopeptidase [Saprospiraceae bacterium]|nr:M56 family metallopeptidase [Saprospiraceae bacterium]
MLPVYAIKVALFWLGSYLVYRFFLEKETFLNWNRVYLLGTLALGLLLPLVNIPQEPSTFMTDVLLPTVTIQWDAINQSFSPVAPEQTIGWTQIVGFIFWTGVIISSIRFAYGITKIIQLRNRSEITRKNEYDLVLTSMPHAPFSFFNWMFWSQSYTVDREEESQIISHELAHIRQGHTFDNLFAEVLSIFFWWNPIIYLYKKAIKDNHEFLADASVIQWKSKKQYGQLLIRQSQVAPAFHKAAQPLAMANHFFHSKLKKRITMITKNASGKWTRLKYLISAPLLAMLLFACQETVEQQADLDSGKITNQDSKEGKYPGDETVLDTEYLIDTVITFDPSTKEESIQIVKTEVFKVVDEMPRFPGCEDETENSPAKDQCAQRKLMEYLGKNLQYPEAAKKDGVEGTVVVSFIVSSYQGKVFDIKILKSLQPDCDKEVIRVMENMPSWTPGKQNGKNVNVRYTLPVKFKLN